jgi:4-hydroxy-tetrahydrodipicolinate reductase
MIPEVFRAKMDEKVLGHAGLLESLYLIADGLYLSFDEVRETVDPFMADRPVKTDYFDLKTGDVAGIKHIVQCVKDGKELITLDLRIYIGAENPHDSIYITGTPDINLRIDGDVAGDQATAAILVNSSPAVIDAKPGLTTVKDLPAPHFIDKALLLNCGICPSFV